jgi:hypothetical protein
LTIYLFLFLVGGDRSEVGHPQIPRISLDGDKLDDLVTVAQTQETKTNLHIDGHVELVAFLCDFCTQKTVWRRELCECIQ